MKIGIFGGSFDPIHTAHLISAQNVLNEFMLDKILFIPNSSPPHKKNKTKISLRYEMVKLAVSSNPKFDISDIECDEQSNKIYYTIDTVRKLKETYPNDNFYLIIGQDSLIDIETWKDYKRLFQEVKFIVITRPNYKAVSFDFLQDANIFYIENQQIDISSSEIREKVKYHDSISYLTPKVVEEFIIKNDLYNDEEITYFINYVKRILPKRFNHCLGVAKVAKHLAQIHNLNEKDAFVAGILHDIAKEFSEEQFKTSIQKYNIQLDEFVLQNLKTSHGIVGAEIAKHELGISNIEILDAISTHVLGAENMSKLQQIIYIADCTEPNRNYPEINTILEEARQSLDKAMLTCLNRKIDYTIYKGQTAHSKTLELRNYYKKLEVNNVR